MREPPELLVEVNGQIVRRPGQLDVLMYDRTGRPTVARVRPSLEPGEQLVERAAAIPCIVREKA